jgi:hypothetical protein
MVLEAIVARNRELFREHGATLWIAGQVDRLTPPCPPPLGAEPTVTAAGPDGAAVELTRQPYLDLVRHLADAEIEAPEGHVGEAAFFDAHPLGGLGLLAHPPARLSWTVDLAERAFLNLTLAIHPAVYEQPGGGVRFLVTVDDEPVLDDVVDPKRQPAHRGWKDLSLDLGPFSGPARRLELRTEAVPEESNAYCTAGWGRAHLASEPNAPRPDLAIFRLR